METEKVCIRWFAVNFIKGATSYQGFPGESLVEIAFVGRSNVGKSSLLNALWGRKRLAYTSKMPGKTAEINFFKVDNHFLCVDLPGYGYARRSRALQHMWQKVLPRYLETRHVLRSVFLLVDSRHEPKVIDQETWEWLYCLGLSVTLVLTKVDKISKKAYDTQHELWRSFILSKKKSGGRDRGTGEGLDLLAFSVKDDTLIGGLRECIEKQLTVIPARVVSQG